MKKLFLVGSICLLVGAVSSYGVTRYFSERNEKTQSQQSKIVEPTDFNSKLAKLRRLKGSAFDKEYMNLLMGMSQDAITVAELSKGRTERDEIDKWSQYVIKTEPNDINALKTWYGEWGYRAEDLKNDPHTH